MQLRPPQAWEIYSIGPWSEGPHIIGAGGVHVCSVDNYDDALRIVASVNALAGFSMEDIKEIQMVAVTPGDRGFG